MPTFCGVRTQTWKYVRYVTGEQELYDLANDPYELSNLAHDPGSQVMLHRLAARTAVLCNPPPPGYASDPGGAAAAWAIAVGALVLAGFARVRRDRRVVAPA